MARINTTDKTKCCGCGACVVACPHGCLRMQTDDEGFVYPIVDEQTCVNCGRCLEVCGMQRPAPLRPAQEAYAAWHADPSIRAKGTSGSVFTALAEIVLRSQGLVAGAAFTEAFKSVEHMLAKTPEELDRLHGSKYLQSETTRCFSAIIDVLNLNRQVLFCGTPCQVASLRLLAGNRDNLITCDLVCHGVPSPGVFRSYLAELESRYRANLRSYQFRDKSTGWNFPRIVATFDNGKTRRRIPWADRFFYGYSMLRPCCYTCPFTRMERAGDLTLGDCWRVAASHPQYDDNKGTSLILINTVLGRRLLDEARRANRLVDGPYDLQLACARNLPLREAASVPASRAEFFRAFREAGSFEQASNVYTRRIFVLRKRIERLIKYIGWPILRRLQ